ncbi:MAG TPA: hypothetical protein VFX12_13330 [Vicinamibacterales bacterium]|nr:hypothetical protein [Vicinamibacterales bacterium]
MRIPVRLLTVAAALLAMAASGCSRKADRQPAVATPSLTLSRARVPIGSPVTLTYTFHVAPDAHIATNDYVFVHMVDPQGEQMWTDDHLPPTPTSQWKPGQTVSYSRTVFVPNYPYIGQASVRLGLYDPATGQRLPLAATEVNRREYTVASFQVLPQSENLYLAYKDGWYAPESDPKDPTHEWQWTGKTAVLSFQNPKKDCTFYLQYDTRTDLFNPPQQATIRVGDEQVAAFAADARNPALKTFPISAAQLGSAPTDAITIAVDRTFAPGGNDPRELGIRVFHAYLAPK